MWYTLVILVLERQGQEDQELWSSLATRQVQGQAEIHETLSKKVKQEKALRM